MLAVLLAKPLGPRRVATSLILFYIIITTSLNGVLSQRLARARWRERGIHSGTTYNLVYYVWRKMHVQKFFFVKKKTEPAELILSFTDSVFFIFCIYIFFCFLFFFNFVHHFTGNPYNYIK